MLRLLHFGGYAVGVVICLAASAIAQESEEVSSVRPNIVYIMFDDLGYADPGCYGGEVLPTPHIDRLAAEGTRFMQVYAGSCVCAPSRNVLMTGQHTGHTRIRANFAYKNGVKGLEDGMRGYLYEEDITVAEVLQEAGYATCMSGKWGLGEPDTPGEPNSQGFDEFYGFLNQRRADHHYPEWLWLNRDRKSLPGNIDGQMGQYAADEFTHYAIDFIERHQDTPFFLYVPFCIPHDNFNLPDFKPFEDKAWKDQEKAYAAMVTHADARVGQIMQALRKNELDERTIVFVCADNGAYDRYEGLFDSAEPFRGKKYELTEGGIRVPMIVRWPGSVPVGVSDAIWYFADVLPTLATLAGAEVPKMVDGINILPTLLGNPQSELENRFLYWEFPLPHFRQAGRMGKWKAIKLHPDEPIALYDLSVDLKETNDMATDYPQIVADFDKRFKASHTESPFIETPK